MLNIWNDENRGWNIYGYKYEYKIVRKFPMQNIIRRIKNNKILIRALVDTVEGQTDFESKDHHPRIKIRNFLFNMWNFSKEQNI
jgi:hypothetical protein